MLFRSFIGPGTRDSGITGPLPSLARPRAALRHAIALSSCPLRSGLRTSGDSGLRYHRSLPLFGMPSCGPSTCHRAVFPPSAAGTQASPPVAPSPRGGGLASSDRARPIARPSISGDWPSPVPPFSHLSSAFIGISRSVGPSEPSPLVSGASGVRSGHPYRFAPLPLPPPSPLSCLWGVFPFDCGPSGLSKGSSPLARGLRSSAVGGFPRSVGPVLSCAVWLVPGLSPGASPFREISRGGPRSLRTLRDRPTPVGSLLHFPFQNF